MSKKKSFKAFDHKTGKIDLTHHSSVLNMLPIEIHHKEDGTYDDKPSFAIVLARSNYPTIVGEISLKMLNDALKDIGYQIKKI